MSLRRHLLNHWMRLVEKPRMARAKGPENLRRALETQARWLFFAPRGTHRNWEVLAYGAHPLSALRIHTPAEHAGRLILYFHGGGFVFGSPTTHAAMLGQLSRRVGACAVLPRYRLAPEAPFPAAVDDARAAWDAVLASGIAPERVIIGGDSAGGALAFGLLGALCAEGAAMPGGVFGLSPLTDMADHGASFHENAAREALLPAKRAAELGQMYLCGHDPNDPRVSPVRADFTGAPPVWLTVADTEILRDDARNLAAKLRACDVDVTFDERHDLPHVWPILHNMLPEARQSLDDVAGWIRRLPGWQGES